MADVEALERVMEILTVEILQLNSVDLVAETFTAQLFIEFRFPGAALDPDLSAKSAAFPFGPDGKPTFRPSARWYVDQIDFNNANKYQILNKDVLEVGQNIHAKIRFEGTFFTNLELTHFPFDCQALTFSLAINCREAGMTPVLLRNAEDLTCQSISNDSFHLQEVYYVQERLHVATGSCGHAPRTFPAVNVTMALERKAGFFIVNVLVPLFLFVPLSCMQFFIPVTELAGRMEFGLAMLFTTVTFKFSISNTLPQISYLTLLDKYLLLGGLINLLICFESAAIWRALSAHAVFHVLEAEDVEDVLGTVSYGSLGYGQMQPVTSAVVMPANGYFLQDGLQTAMIADEACFLSNCALWLVVNVALVCKLYSLRDLNIEPPPPTAGTMRMRRLKSLSSEDSQTRKSARTRRVSNWLIRRSTSTPPSTNKTNKRASRAPAQVPRLESVAQESAEEADQWEAEEVEVERL